MRALLLHANSFATSVRKKSNWPDGIVPEKRKSTSEKMEHCLVCFFCVEKGDTEKQVQGLHDEIVKTAVEVKTENLMIAPFVHLSASIADPGTAKKLYMKLMEKFGENRFNVRSSHFGYHKSLLLDVKGHPGSFRYREFY